MTRPPGYLARLGAGLAAIVRRPLVRSGAGVGALSAADMALGLISAVLLARELGAEGLGLYALAMAVAVLAGLPVEFGLPGLVMREVAHASADDRAGATKGVIVFAMTVIGLSSAVVVPVVIVAAASPVGGLGGEVRQILPVAVLLIPVNGFGRVLGAALAGRERVALGAVPQRLVRPGAFALALAVAILVEPGWLTPARAIKLQLGAGMMAVAVAVVLFLAHFRGTLRQRGKKVYWSAWLGATLRLGISRGMMQAQPQLLMLLTGALASVEAVGLLRIALRAADVVRIGTTVAATVASPRVARLFAEGAHAQLQRLVVVVARTAFAISLIGLGGFLLAGHWLLATVFGAEFVSAWNVLMVLSAAHGIVALFGPGVMLMNMARREAVSLSGQAISLVLSMALAALLAAPLGALGAACGRATGVIAMAAFLRHRARRDLGFDPAVGGASVRSSGRVRTLWK